MGEAATPQVLSSLAEAPGNAILRITSIRIGGFKYRSVTKSTKCLFQFPLELQSVWPHQGQEYKFFEFVTESVDDVC